MAQKNEQIWYVGFEDNSIELFHDWKSANDYFDRYLQRNAKQILDTDKFGPLHKTITFLTHSGYETFITISAKVVH